MHRALGAAGVPLLALVAWLGCGGAEQAPQPSGTSLTAPAPPGERDHNRAPVVESVRLNPSDPLPGVPISAVVSAHDPDGDSLRVEYAWSVNGDRIASGPHPSVTVPDLAKGDRLEVVVTATDGRLESEPGRAWADVGNRPPFIAGVEITPTGTVRRGDTLTASPLVSDPDNDRLRFQYTWLVNGVQSGEGRELATDALSRGDRVQVRVVASDGREDSRAVESAEIVLGNTPPRIARLPELETDSGVFRYQFEAIDDDGDRNLRFWLEQAPPGMSIDPVLGTVTWRPGASQAGVHPVEVGVRDPSGEGSTFLFEVTVTATAPSDASQAGAPPPAAPDDDGEDAE